MKKTTTLTAILCSCCLVFAWTVQATAANLQLGVSQAPASGVSAAVIGIVGADDVESFTLTLNFANGTLLNLATAGWYTRHQYLPASLFGPAPQVDRNLIHNPSLSKKVYFNGFAPSGDSGDVGVVTFNVAAAAVANDTQVLSLTGEYLSKSTGQVQSFPTVTATFTVGAYLAPVAGDVNNDGTIDLVDAIMSLRVATGLAPGQTLSTGADVDGDKKIGMPEVIHIIRKAANQQ